MICSMLVDSLVTMTREPSGETATPSGSMPTSISAIFSPFLGLYTEALASSSLEMYGEGFRIVAAFERAHHFELLGIEHGNRIVAADRHVDFAAVRRDAHAARPLADRDGCDDLVGGGIDHAHRVVTLVADEYPAARRMAGAGDGEKKGEDGCTHGNSWR